ncbi:MAG TPA: alpha-(1-_3)-arabinofuranosyltransferase family protein, partial [Ilumatobacteraceae bacterium]
VFEQLHAPDWIAHRLWIATVLFAGGLGVRWAARQLGLAGVGAITAAFVYQLSPYILPYLSRTSLMLLPWASVGWLVGLTIRSATRSRWRDPAIFALVILTVGSPNATALAMIAPAPILWLLHAAWQRSISWRRAFVTSLRIGALSLGVSLWWIAMLLVQSRHGADVLSYSETLEAVSFTSVSTETLRGLGYWLFYIRDPAGFATSASANYLESGRIIAIGFALLLCCVAGIALTRWTQRRYAAMLVFTGIVLAVGVHPIDHPSPLMSKLATSSRSTLSLAMRSSTRALPLSNFGLALGAGALATVGAAIIGRRRPRLRLLVPAAVVLFAILNLPALFDGGFVDPALERDQNPPAAWREAAAALDAGSMEHRVMQLPGAEFGAFRWGFTVDPPLPGMTRKPLITRDLLPLGSPAAMDLLYALDDRAQTNVLDPSSIAPVARFFGADTIWVSNDMAFERFRTPRPELTNELFAAKPEGLDQPTSFGAPTPNVPALAMVDETALSNKAIGAPLPPVELVNVERPVAMVRAASRVVVLSGSGDGIVDASAAGLLNGDEAVFYAGDLRPSDNLTPDLVVLTDSNRDRAHQWRGTQDVVGFTETGGPATDVLTPDTADQRLPVFADQSATHQTTATIEGLDVRATGYGEPFAYRPEDRPAMAVDGDPSTAWLVADRFDPVGQRIEVTGDVGNLSLLQSQQPGASRMITAVRVEFDNGAAQDVELGAESLAGSGQRIDVPAGATSARITILAVVDRPGASDAGPSAVGFAELGLGSHPEVVRLPRDAVDASPDTPLDIVLTRLRTDPLNRWRSDPEPRMNREFTLSVDRAVTARITLRRNDRASDDALDAFAGVRTATSNRRLTGDAGSTAVHAVDGDLTTMWTSPFSDVVGSALTIPLTSSQPTSSITLTQPADESHSVITTVSVAIAGVSTTVDVPPPDAQGRSTIAFPAATADSLTLTVAAITPRTTVDRRYGETTVLPVAISEIQSPSIAAVQPVDAPPECRTDLVEVDGAPLPVTVGHDSMTQLLAGAAVDVEPCTGGTIALAAGDHRISTAPGLATGIDVDRIVLQSGPPPSEVGAAPAPTVDVRRERTRRTATVSNCPTGCWLILGEGFNDGWKATLAGKDLGPPRPVSGGFNGWRLPGSTTPVTVTMTWTPQGTMWIGMLLAALVVLACLVLICLDRKRVDVPEPSPPVLQWPPVKIGRRPALVAAGALVVLSALTIAPSYALVAAVAGLVIVAVRRPIVAGVASVALVAGVAAVIIRRQIRYRLVANPSWPAAFDDLHRPGLLVVALLLVSTLADDCPAREPDEVT